MRQFASWLLAVVLVVGAALPALAAETGVTIDGKPLAFDVAPAAVDGTLMVPVRAVAEALGGNVAWDEGAGTATIHTAATTVVLTPGQPMALVDGEAVDMDTPATLSGGRLLVPAGFLLTLFGSRVTIVHPALRDPQAMAWLAGSATNAPRDYAMVLDQKNTVTLLGPQPQTIPYGITVRGQWRGADALVTTTMEAAPIPGGSVSAVTVLRGGRVFTRVANSWAELPAAAGQGMVSTANAQAFLQTVREAHLGALRYVAGQPYQDVVVTFDAASLQGLVGQIVKPLLASVPSLQLAMSPESARATYTFAVAGGTLTGSTMDAVVLITAHTGNQSLTMRVTVHQTQKVTPERTLINWPEGLPQP